MTSWLANLLAAALDPAEREAVLGDLTESGQPAAPPVIDLLGLVVRRQLLPWKHWQPWALTIALVIPLGFYLSLLSVMSSYQSVTLLLNASHRVRFDHAIAEFILGRGSACLSVACIAWTMGLAIGAIARRTRFALGVVFCLLVCFLCATSKTFFGDPVFRTPDGQIIPRDPTFRSTYGVLLTAAIVLVFALYPALCGIYQGSRIAYLAPRLRRIFFVLTAATLGFWAIPPVASFWFSLLHRIGMTLGLSDRVLAFLQLLLIGLFTFWPIGYWIISQWRASQRSRQIVEIPFSGR